LQCIMLFPEHYYFYGKDVLACVSSSYFSPCYSDFVECISNGLV
jgi:hypothetical protein